jgi:HK97 family phage prohead protease
MEKNGSLQKKVKETRIFQFEKLQVEERSDGLGPKITGYAAVFNKWSEDLGGFKERISSGAFKKAIPKSDVRGLFNHDPNYILGRQSNGTLQIKEDKNGLWMEIDPPDTPLIRDLVLAPIKRGDITQQSFGFIVKKDTWDNIDGEKKDKPVTRTIVEVDELFDVSPVTFPAYPDTSVALRSMEKAKAGTGKVTDESDVLNVTLIEYLNAKEPEETQAAAIKMVETLLPKLTNEQRTKLISTLKPDGEPPDASDDIDDDSSDGEAKAENRWQKLDKKIAKVLRG